MQLTPEAALEPCWDLTQRQWVTPALPPSRDIPAPAACTGGAGGSCCPTAVTAMGVCRCREGGTAIPGVRTHRAPRGVTDVAVGDGFVDGKSKICPPDVADHLPVPPDRLQAEHGHLPARHGQSCHSTAPLWVWGDPGSAPGQPTCQDSHCPQARSPLLAEPKVPPARLAKPPAALGETRSAPSHTARSSH